MRLRKSVLYGVSVLALMVLLTMVSSTPALAQQSQVPTLTCPAGTTLGPTFTGDLRRDQAAQQSISHNFNLAYATTPTLTVWSKVGHPENGCLIGSGNDGGVYPCDQGQLHEEFYIDVNGNNVAFVPDHGEDQWQFFGTPSAGALGAGTHTITFRHSLLGSSAESVGYLAGLCVAPPPPPPPPSGDDGCTIGYWKNHLDAWQGYNPAQTLQSVFDVPDSLGLDNYTLLEALDFGGGPGALGGAKNLLRQAVAAVLNATHGGVGYPLTAAQIIADVNASLATGNRNHMLALKDQLDRYNNLGCPLN